MWSICSISEGTPSPAPTLALDRRARMRSENQGGRNRIDVALWGDVDDDCRAVSTRVIL